MVDEWVVLKWIGLQGVPKKVLMKNFNSDLLITLIQGFFISLDLMHL